MKKGKGMIESCKLARIEVNALRLRKVLDAVLSAHYSVNDRLGALQNIYPVVLNLVRDTNEVCRDLDKDEKFKVLGLINDVKFAIETYEETMKETQMLIDLPNQRKVSPKIAGRPKASTDKHLKDFLKVDDPEKVIQVIKKDSKKKRAGYFGQLLIALLDLGYIELSDIGKELYEALRNDFPDAPGISSIGKICPQTKWKIDEYKNRNKTKIEELKRLF